MWGHSQSHYAIHNFRFVRFGKAISSLFTRDVISIAAPVLSFNAQVICAVSIAFAAYIDDDRGIEMEIAAVKKNVLP